MAEVKISIKNSESFLMLGLNDLVDFQKDLKKLSEEQYGKLKRSLVKQGYSFPVCVWEDSGIHYILDGHQRVKALKRMSEEGVVIPSAFPVVSIDAKNYGAAKRLLLSATSQYGKIDKQGLFDFQKDADINIDELMEEYSLADTDMEEFEKEYFPDDSINQDVGDSKKGDAIPDVDERDVEVKLGDVWQIGKHFLSCGSATEMQTYKRLLGDVIPNMTFTSPPYNLGTTSRLRTRNIKENEHKSKDSAYDTKSDHLSSDQYFRLLVDSSNLFMLSDISLVNIQLLAGNKTAFFKYISVVEDSIKDVFVWNKEPGCAPPISKNVYNAGFEFIIVMSNRDRKNVSRAINVGTKFHGKFSNIFQLEDWRKKEEIQKKHGAVFPVSLPEMFIDRHVDETVLDPFGGTGSTLIAAERCGKICYTSELNPYYCQIIIDRFKLAYPNQSISRLSSL